MRSSPLLILFLVLAADASASPPRCTAGQEGAVACMDGKLCACRHEPGGSLTGRRAGTRWDCGALRPACGAAPPASADAPGQPSYPSPFLPMPSPSGWR